MFKKRRRKGYKVKNGHRQYITKIQVEGISEKGGAKPATEKAEPKVEVIAKAPKAEATTAKKETAPKAAVKKPAVKKAEPKAVAKKLAAKKPAAKKGDK